MSQNEFPPLEEVHTSLKANLDRAWLFLNDLTINPDTRSYLYAALDLRFFIERLMSVLLRLSHDGSLSKTKSKLYRPKDYEKQINLELINNLIATIDLQGKSCPAIDINNINRIYGKLGNYLHAPKTEFSVIDDEEWKLTLEAEVLSAYDYLKPYAVYERVGEKLTN